MKKGFTLVELIGVIVIIGVLAVFAVPALTKTMKNSADKEYDEFVKNITLAAENYFHNETDGKINHKVFIKVSRLAQAGYLKKTVNPLTKTNVDDNATVIIYKDIDNIEKYQFVDMDVTETGYVTDGLVLLYDGYRAPEGNSLIDLSGHENNGLISSATWQNYYYNLDGIDDYITSNLTMDGSYGTIEICSEYTNGNTILGTNTSIINNLGVSKDSNSEFINPTNFGTRGIRYSTPNYNAYFNGVLSTSQTFSSENDLSYVSIGSSNTSGSSLSSGKFYSVRVYNRFLTEDEIKQNYIVDTYRFGA